MRKRFKLYSKKLIKYFLLFGITLIILLFGSDLWISYSTKNQLINNVDDVYPHEVAMVLGTAKYMVGGGINPFFQYRMEAVKTLFDNGKIKKIIVSGDNSVMEYNETRDMKRYLIKLGIEEENIIEDFAGFSTIDSVIRVKEVFNQDSIIIVSQPFHNERAVFIANHHNIKAIGFNAQNVNRNFAKKVYFREYFARVKCIIDIYILGTMPKFY